MTYYPLDSGMFGRRMRRVEGGFEVGPNVPHSMTSFGFEFSIREREWVHGDGRRVAEGSEEDFIARHRRPRVNTEHPPSEPTAAEQAFAEEVGRALAAVLPDVPVEVVACANGWERSVGIRWLDSERHACGLSFPVRSSDPYSGLVPAEQLAENIVRTAVYNIRRTLDGAPVDD